ncbi:MAG: pirin family protein [Thermoanaerobaculia bacterium]|nr:pirin family protein [Thermoanaerobaculia bacterium]
MPTAQALPARTTYLGMLEIRRALPIRERRMIGPWCFLDRYGPLSFSDAKPMDVAPHPHIGLQTVTWLLEGEVLHRDSLGSESLIRPGELNVMTSGRGISHSEETPRGNSGRLSGVQLWVALPDADRNQPASFEHHDDLPRMESPAGNFIVFSGAAAGLRSSASAYSQMTGAEITIHAGQRMLFPLDITFEYGVMLVSGEAQLGEERLEIDTLYYLAPGDDALTISTRAGGKLLLLGGVPFDEPIFMWWNFVARTAAEIAEAQREWNAREDSERFGKVSGYNGSRINAPPFPLRVPPPPAS